MRKIGIAAVTLFGLFLIVGLAEVKAQDLWTNTSLYDDGVDRQWFTYANNDTVCSLGAFGIRTVYMPKEGTPVLLAENPEPAVYTKWARGCEKSDNLLYVVTRQASAGKTEKFIPQYRFRFDKGINDYSKNKGEFDDYISKGGVSIDERGNPCPNYGIKSARLYSSGECESEGEAILSKQIDFTEGMYSSLWCNIRETGEEEFLIPLYLSENGVSLSLVVKPLSKDKVSISLSSSKNETASMIEISTREWFCLKVFADKENSGLWYRTKECGEWLKIDEGIGIEADNICIGLKTSESNLEILVDDYYCNPSDIDLVSYVNGSVEIYTEDNLNLVKKLFSDIKLIKVKKHKDYLIVSGIWGFNIYSIICPDDPELVFSHRSSSYTEFQSFDIYEDGDKTYLVFSIYSKGICVWDITDPKQASLVVDVPLKGLVLDNYNLSSAYTFDVVADFPYVYATIMSDFGGENDCRGIIRYDVSDLTEVDIQLYPVPTSDLYMQHTADNQPTVIRKYQNNLFINFSEKGLAQYELTDKGCPNYVGLVPMSGRGSVLPFWITDAGTIFAGLEKRSTIYRLDRQGTTDLKTIEDAEKDEIVFYDLTGRKHTKPGHGFYISNNGRKVIK